jgi:hypothetical protein
MIKTTLLGIVFSSSTVSAMEVLSTIKMERTGWSSTKCSAIDELTIEFVLNTPELQLRKLHNIGPKRVLYVKERLMSLIPMIILDKLPLFNPDAQPILTSAQKEREEAEAARKAKWEAEHEDLAKIIAEYGFDDEDDE